MACEVTFNVREITKICLSKESKHLKETPTNNRCLCRNAMYVVRQEFLAHAHTFQVQIF